MLHEFLSAERAGILALCAKKLSTLSETRSSSDEMELGLPVFYDELIEVLRADHENGLMESDKNIQFAHQDSAKLRGKESLRLGYTVSQVVHGYGALCQSITEYVKEHDSEIDLREFNRLNYCLDVAIAEAVTEYSRGKQEKVEKEELLRLGFLAHEMRNALANVAIAHRLMKEGVVGFGGSTSRVVEGSLTRMKDIIDRSLSEVRLRGDLNIEVRQCSATDIVSEIEAIARLEADAKSITIGIDLTPGLVIMADRHLMVSALSNLVQNAIKFTHKGGHIWIRGKALEGRVLIEVEDECGGLPPGKIESLFQPFAQKGEDRTGLGLGLSICRRAISLHHGEVTARSLPSKGCIFTIDLPQAAI